MSCLLPLIAGICIADPSTLTLEAGASWQAAGSTTYYDPAGKRYNGPVGVAALNLSVQITRQWSATYGIEHTSLLYISSDRGEERWIIRARWQPFR